MDSERMKAYLLQQTDYDEKPAVMRERAAGVERERALEREVARLREALEKINNDDCDCDYGYSCVAGKLLQIADEALKGTGNEPKIR